MSVNQKTNKRRDYAGIASEERDSQRREALIAAGIAAFGERGYAGTTIESLCSAASVSTRDFYHYFATKEALLLAVYDQIIEATMISVGQAISERLSDNDESAAVIRAGIAAFAESMVNDERWARINFIEIVGVSPRVELRRREVIRNFGSLVATINTTLAERDGTGDSSLPLVHSVALVGAVHETLTDWVTHDDRPPLGEAIDALVDVFTAVLLR